MFCAQPDILRMIRRCRFRIALAVGLLLMLAAPLRAEPYDVLFEEFDARSLAISEKRFLQAALAFEGYYNALLDGIWGGGSQRAIERYARAEFDSDPLNVHMATLLLEFLEAHEREGWAIRYFPDLAISFAFPETTMIEQSAEGGLRHWAHEEMPFSIFTSRDGPEAMPGLHRWALSENDPGFSPYSVRKSDLWVTAVEAERGGIVIYLRSDFVAGAWSTVILRAGRDHGHLLNGVSTSISPGRATDLSFPEGGRLEELAVLTFEMFAALEDEDQKAVEAPGPATPDNGSVVSSGSGFHVDLSGHILTNAHVVSGCGSVLVGDQLAEVRAVSDDFDLALLRVPRASPIAATFSDRPADLNEDVTVVGYPLSDLLGGLNVTRGSVASLTGLRGNAVTMQISAPVQSGNSGGPVIDASGRIVGVVVSKLDAVRFADLLGEIPQNINFAIRGEAAKLFLSGQGVRIHTASDTAPVPPTLLAKDAAQYTVLVECL